MRNILVMEDADIITVEKSLVEGLEGFFVRIDDISIQGSEEKMIELAKQIILQLPQSTFDKVFDSLDEERHDETYKVLSDECSTLRGACDRLEEQVDYLTQSLDNNLTWRDSDGR